MILRGATFPQKILQRKNRNKLIAPTEHRLSPMQLRHMGHHILFNAIALQNKDRHVVRPDKQTLSAEFEGESPLPLMSQGIQRIVHR